MLLDTAYRHYRDRLFRESADDPEEAHEKVMRWLKKLNDRPLLRGLLRWYTSVDTHYLQQDVFGLWFPTPVGLAAGFDKDCQALHALAALGFGFIEGGTIVPRPQEGNERPRIVRLTEENELLNRMGFNSGGATLAERNLIQAGKLGIPLGLSLGKNKDTLNKLAALDYQMVLLQLYEYGDYFVVNVSSPNTPGLRELQSQAYLHDLLSMVMQTGQLRTKALGLKRPKPILVKISPEVTDAEMDRIIYVAIECGMSGCILANTQTAGHGGKAWGRSGPSLFSRMLEMVSFVHERTEGTFPIIASGGINSVDRAWKAMEAGANLVQIYTGLVYEGPGLPRRLNKGLSRHLKRAKKRSGIVWVR